jgi:hypothetical protein
VTELPFLGDEETWVCVACRVRFPVSALHPAWLSWVSDEERLGAEDCKRLQEYRRSIKQIAREAP